MGYSHYSVMKNEILSFINTKENKTLIDATLGMGGHTLSISEASSGKFNFLCFDQDKESIEIAKEKLSPFKENIKYFHTNFKNLKNYIDDKVDYILADLGISTYQLSNKKRGFSFTSDERLDMRMDKEQILDAHYIINNYNLNNLSAILRDFGEERNHYKIASYICKERTKKKINTCKELSDLIDRCSSKKSKINSSTKTFMALRIEVNNELDSLKEFLKNSLSLLKPNGRLMVISFHSLEDRIVKNFMKFSEKNCICPSTQMFCSCNKKSELKILTKKPILPCESEISENPSSRSAKLRVGEAIWLTQDWLA